MDQNLSGIIGELITFSGRNIIKIPPLFLKKKSLGGEEIEEEFFQIISGSNRKRDVNPFGYVLCHQARLPDPMRAPDPETAAEQG